MTDFDDNRAGSYVPVEQEKIAVLVVPVAETVEIATAFGHQVMRGPFYAVADGEGSYGAAKREFEATHRRVGPTAWAKVAPVRAYQTDAPCTVVTRIDDHDEVTQDAAPGDWLVRQTTGEIMVIGAAAFEERYRPATPD